jgi:hypothetical protein
VTDVPEHPYGDGAPPVARASPPDNGAAFFMPPVLEWSSKKMAHSQADDLMELIALGACLDLEASAIPQEDLLQLVASVRDKADAKVTLRVRGRPQHHLVQLAALVPGKITFAM